MSTITMRFDEGDDPEQSRPADGHIAAEAEHERALVLLRHAKAGEGDEKQNKEKDDIRWAWRRTPAILSRLPQKRA